MTNKEYDNLWEFWSRCGVDRPDDSIIANRDIFGRELWLACRLRADREVLLSNYEIMAFLRVKVEEFRQLASRLATAQKAAFAHGKECAVSAIEEFTPLTRQVKEQILDEQFGSWRIE